MDFSRFEAVFLDLDGTVYHEEHPLPGAVELIAQLQRHAIPYACLSNSAASPERVSVRLQQMGMAVPPRLIYTAAATCDYLLAQYGETARVFNLATTSVHEMLAGRVHWVEAPDQPCDVVIAAGPGGEMASEARQRVALHLLRNGAVLLGLCADRVFPSPRGLEFGAGAMCAFLAYAADVHPVFCGKPEAVFFRELCRRMHVQPDRCVLIGDNLESDVMGAKAVGMTAVLVLSGVARQSDVRALPLTLRPDVIIESLTELEG
ncbi:MAG: HAD hydrolase-like protein [Vicinamibacterales bacterium]